jgi:hypothetical protein
MKYVIGVQPFKTAVLDKIKELGVPSARMGETVVTFDSGSAFVLAATMLRQERIPFRARSLKQSGSA